SLTRRALTHEFDLELNRLPLNRRSRIKQPASCGDQLSSPESEIDSAQINSALADLKDQRLRSTRLHLLDRPLHEEMAVSTGDEVNPVDLRGELAVVNAVASRICGVTEMRHANDQRAMLLFAQRLHHVARDDYRVVVSNAFEILRRDQRHRTHA